MREWEWTSYKYTLAIQVDPNEQFHVVVDLLRYNMETGRDREDYRLPPIANITVVADYERRCQAVQKRNPDMTASQVSQRALHDWWCEVTSEDQIEHDINV